MIVLSGDIGGTNSRFALFAKGETAVLFEKTYPSSKHTTFESIAESFLHDARAAGIKETPSRACFGIAGPVENNVCRATNLPWVIDGRLLQHHLSIPLVKLVNDFYAAALGAITVGSEHLVPLGGGARDPRGPVAVLGAGTGLGQAFLLWSAAEERYQVVPSEGGHADLAPRSHLESALMQYLTGKYGRVSLERVLSGNGLVDAWGFLQSEPALRAVARPETATAMAVEDPAAVISRHALEGRDPVCEMALAIFCGVLGALAGNLALQVLATGGVYVAGGIAPRILPFLQRGLFREAFERKGRLQTMVARMPAFVVTHPQPGLLGAAAIASSL